MKRRPRRPPFSTASVDSNPLLLVELQSLPELLERVVYGFYGLDAMATEIMVRALKVFLGLLQLMDGSPNVGMTLFAFVFFLFSSLGRRGSHHCRCHAHQ